MEIAHYYVRFQGVNTERVDSKSKGLGFDSHGWYCIEVLGKLFPCCFCPPSSSGYLLEIE